MSAVRVLHLTDPHLFADAEGELRGEKTARSLESVVDAALDGSRPPPDAVVVTGDIAQDESRGAYHRFREILADARAPVYCVPGNHDNPAFMAEILDAAPFQYCGSAWLGGWRLHFLPTWVEGEVGGRLEALALAALETDLATHAAAPTLLFLHHHPVPTGSRWLDPLGLENAAALLALTERNTQVRGVVWGHIHQAVDQQNSHCRLLATPSTCRQFRPNTERFQVDDRPPAWRWLSLRDDGTLETELYWLDRD